MIDEKRLKEIEERWREPEDDHLSFQQKAQVFSDIADLLLCIRSLQAELRQSNEKVVQLREALKDLHQHWNNPLGMGSYTFKILDQALSETEGK